MLLGHLALVVAALFAGAAFYVNFAEQPARLAIDDRPALRQWQRSYERAALMQATLAIVGFLPGLAAWWWEGGDPRLLVGAVAIVLAWPYTLLVIKPVNDRLNATSLDRAGTESRAPIERWARLHAGRTAGIPRWIASRGSFEEPEPGPSGCRQPDGPRAVFGAPFWSRINDA